VSAADNLQPKQFMPVARVGKMKSGDWGGTVEDAYQRNRSDLPDRFEGLLSDIGENGVLHPIDVSGNHHTLLNGHHRYYAARELGMDALPYRDR
jgi:hypothetical protein